MTAGECIVIVLISYFGGLLVGTTFPFMPIWGVAIISTFVVVVAILLAYAFSDVDLNGKKDKA